MLKRSGPFNKRELVEAARGYLSLYEDGRVPYQERMTGKIGWVVFEKIGVYYKFKEIVKA